MAGKRKRQRDVYPILIILFAALAVLSVTVPLYINVSTRNGLNQTVSLAVETRSDISHGVDNMLGVGDFIMVIYTLENTGEAPIENVTLFSMYPNVLCIPDGMNNTIGDMAPGQSATCNVLVSITQEMIQMVGLTFDVEFHTNGVPIEPLSPTNIVVEVVTDTVPDMNIMFSEVLDLGGDGILNIGDILYVNITFTNTGNQTLLNVTTPYGSVGILEPMHSVTYQEAINITVTELVDEMVRIEANATATPISTLQELYISSEFYANLTEFITAELQLNMTYSFTGDPANQRCDVPGYVVTVTATVESIGAKTITDVAVTDTKVGTSFVCGPMNNDNTIGTLLPGQVQICTANYITTSADFNAPALGAFISDTTVSGTDIVTMDPYSTMEHNMYQFTEASDVRMYITGHLVTSGHGVEPIRWKTLRLLTYPGSWVGPSTFIVPVAGTYDIRCVVYWLAVSNSPTTLKINGVITGWSVQSGRYDQRTIALNVGDIVQLWDQNTNLAGLDAHNSAWFCITRIP